MKVYNGIYNISEPDNDYSIYLIYSSNPLDKSIYIGVTSNYKQRVYKHSVDKDRKSYSHKPLYIWMNSIINKKDGQIIFEVIDSELSEDLAFSKEIIFIKIYKDLGYNVLNTSEGGKGYKGNIPWNKGKVNLYTKEYLDKLSKSHIGKIGGMNGKNHSEDTKALISLRNKERKDKGWINPRKKKVFKYTKDNELLAVYSDLSEAANKENVSPSSIGEWCRGEKNSRNKFIYSYISLE